MLKKNSLIFCLMLVLRMVPATEIPAPTIISFDLAGEVSGSLSIPDGEGELPIVFIIPEAGETEEGRHLFHEISALNILAIFLHVDEVEADEQSLATIFKRCLLELNRALQGESLAFGVDLYNKGSLSQVVMIGYGQSVDGIYQMIHEQNEKQMSVCGVLCVAPKRKQEVPELQMADVPMAFIIPHTLLEENAVSLSLFQKNRASKNRQSITAMVYVEGDDDHFVSKYAGAFVQGLFAGFPPDMGLSVLEPAPRRIFQRLVKTSLVVPETLAIWHPEREKNLHFDGLTLHHYKGLVDLYRVKWEQANSSLVIELPIDSRDVSRYDALSIYMNYHHVAEEKLSFVVEFCDVEGQRQQVKFEEMSPLNYVSSTVIPFYHERIILQDLMEVDLTSLKSIHFLFEELNAGELNIGELSFVRN